MSPTVAHLVAMPVRMYQSSRDSPGFFGCAVSVVPRSRRGVRMTWKPCAWARGQKDVMAVCGSCRSARGVSTHDSGSYSSQWYTPVLIALPAMSAWNWTYDSYFRTGFAARPSCTGLTAGLWEIRYPRGLSKNWRTVTGPVPNRVWMLAASAIHDSVDEGAPNTYGPPRWCGRNR